MKTIIGVIVTGVLLFVLIDVAVNNSSSISSSTSTKPVTPTILKENYPKSIGMREQFSVGYWTYRVNNENWAPVIHSLGMEKADAMFLAVDITVRNDDNTPSTIPPFKLIQPGGGANGQDQEFEAKETFMDCQLSALKTLNPGVQKRGCIVFDAPWNYYNLQFSGGYESGKVANVWIHDNINSDAPRYYKEEAPEKAILR
jgi:hypothetical protein